MTEWSRNIHTKNTEELTIIEPFPLKSYYCKSYRKYKTQYMQAGDVEINLLYTALL